MKYNLEPSVAPASPTDGAAARDSHLQLHVPVSCSKWHPDRHADKSESEKKKAEERFKDIAHAYETLSDPEKRRVYDQVRPQRARLHLMQLCISGG